MKKHFTIKSVLIALLAMVSCTMKAETIDYRADDGYAYYLYTETQEATLWAYFVDATEVIVPKFVTYEEKEYKVTSLGFNCFGGHSSLTSIELPSSVTSLGDRCFFGCSSLTSIEIPSSVTSLGWYCFDGCSSLASIEIPSSVTSLGWYCFDGCSSLASIELPSSVTSLGNWCFSGCSSLAAINIPSSVTNFGYGCFYGCSSLTSIVVDAANPKYDSREGCDAIIETESNTMIAGCKSTKIPVSVTGLGDSCFEGCLSLTSIDIPSSVTSLGGNCFFDCSSLTSIKLPASVTSLGYWCFRGCSSLASIVVDAANPKYDSREGCNAIIETESNTMILGCKNTKIPASVTSLGAECFLGCTSLTSLEIPASVTNLGEYCFSNCTSIESIVVDAANPKYDSREGCNAIIETESNTLIFGCKNTRIPVSVTSLGDNSFASCSSLTSIDIPSSVTSLGDGCFSGCSSLTSIKLPASLASLGDLCFSGCSSLASIELPTSVTSLGDLCFFGCSSLASIELPTSVTSLGWRCFSDCSSLTSVVIPESVTSVGERCFSACSSLASVVIPESMTSLGNYCFDGCSSLTTVICKMRKIDSYSRAFDYDVPIKDAILYIPNNVGDYYYKSPWRYFGTIQVWTEELEVGIDETPELGIALNTDKGNVVVSGLADGTPVSCYTVDGRLLGKASVDGGTVSFAAEPNSIVIVKVGKESFKVRVK